MISCGVNRDNGGGGDTDPKEEGDKDGDAESGDGEVGDKGGGDAKSGDGEVGDKDTGDGEVSEKGGRDDGDSTSGGIGLNPRLAEDPMVLEGEDGETPPHFR
jgi:hypothetical protein